MRGAGLDKNYVSEILSYDRESGIFHWLVSRGSVKAGRVAGSPQTSRGKTYIQIRIDKRFYKAHHLAWLFHHVEWPMFDLDHVDGDGTNNRIQNLRKCTMSQNKGNSRRYKNNRSGHKGVFFRRGKWSVSIQKDRVRIHVGTFTDLEEAVAAYWRASKNLFGKFARAA